MDCCEAVRRALWGLGVMDGHEADPVALGAALRAVRATTHVQRVTVGSIAETGG